jgi:hypothetical protein
VYLLFKLPQSHTNNIVLVKSFEILMSGEEDWEKWADDEPKPEP